MNQTVLNVLYQSDDNYAIFMGVSILSLFMNTKNISINVYIIDIGISERNREMLLGMAEQYLQKIIFLSTEELYETTRELQIAKYSSFRKNKTSYYKMFIDKLISEEIEKIVYIDCDTLVVGNLAEILEVDIENFPIGMVQDALAVHMEEKYIGFKNEPYFNSGIILFNMREWRQRNCAERIVDHAERGHKYGTVDQDYLNVVLRGEIKQLDVKFNMQYPYYIYGVKTFEKVFRQPESYYTYDELRNAFEEPCILHFLRFCGESPWHKNSVHPMRKLFDQYLIISPWKNYVKKKSDNGGIFVLEKILYKILPRPIFCRIFKIAHDRMLINSNSSK